MRHWKFPQCRQAFRLPFPTHCPLRRLWHLSRHRSLLLKVPKSDARMACDRATRAGNASSGASSGTIQVAPRHTALRIATLARCEIVGVGLGVLARSRAAGCHDARAYGRLGERRETWRTRRRSFRIPMSPRQLDIFTMACRSHWRSE